MAEDLQWQMAVTVIYDEHTRQSGGLPVHGLDAAMVYESVH